MTGTGSSCWRRVCGPGIDPGVPAVIQRNQAGGIRHSPKGRKGKKCCCRIHLGKNTRVLGAYKCPGERSPEWGGHLWRVKLGTEGLAGTKEPVSSPFCVRSFCDPNVLMALCLVPLGSGEKVLDPWCLVCRAAPLPASSWEARLLPDFPRLFGLILPRASRGPFPRRALWKWESTQYGWAEADCGLDCFNDVWVWACVSCGCCGRVRDSAWTTVGSPSQFLGPGSAGSSGSPRPVAALGLVLSSSCRSRPSLSPLSCGHLG